MKTFYADEQKRHDPKASCQAARRSRTRNSRSVSSGCLPAQGRPAARSIVRKRLRSWPDRRRPYAGISRIPAAHLSALAAHRRRLAGGDPEHPSDRAQPAAIRPPPSARPATTWPIQPARSRPRPWTAPAGAPGSAVEAAEAVMSGEPRRLCALPAARPSRLRRCRRRLLLPQQFGRRRAAIAEERGPRRDPRCRPAPRQRHAGHFLCAPRRADRLDPRRSGALLSVLLGPCRRARRRARASATISTCRWRANPATRSFSKRSKSPANASGPSRPKRWCVALGLDAFEGDPFGGLSVSTPGFARIAEAIAKLGLPTVIVQEGGYLCDALGDNLTSFLTGWGSAI